MQRKWLMMAMLNLLIAMSIGALLRFAFIEEISWLKFTNFLHAHSHVAMLGWVYLALFAFLVFGFLSKSHNLIKYNILFWLTQVTVLGMLITFPRMGYASWSIGFSVAHTILSYIFIFYFIKDLRKFKPATRGILWSHKFIKTGLFFMFFSTLGLWMMGPLIVSDMQGGAIYYSTIQFYLHFQFNGWFIFTILGLFFKIIENNNINISQKYIKSFFLFLIISCFLTYALAITWSKPLPFLFIINSSGVLLQLIALYFFIKIVKKGWKQFKPLFSNTAILLFKISFFSFVIKILVQTAVIVPTIGIIGYTIRNFVMGFLHLMLIGMVTLFLFAYAHVHQFLRFKSIFSKIGIRIFIVGFILSEIVLITQGMMFWAAKGFLPKYYELIFGVSALIPIGLAFVLFAQLPSYIKNSKK